MRIALAAAGWNVPAVLLVLAVCGLGVFLIRSRIRNFSRSVFGTDSIAEGLNRQADEAANTPKSVSGMTRLMEPQIVRDFPEFVWEEFKHRAENLLTLALAAVTEENEECLQDASESVRLQVCSRIRENRAAQVKEVYRGIRIHQTEIADYKKGGGRCVVTIQSAVEYYYYRLEGGRVTQGSRERKRQTKYNMELVYIQDARALAGNAVGTVCPHCGAPVTALGHMVCEYCGSAVTPLNIKVWAFHTFYEVDYHHV